MQGVLRTQKLVFVEDLKTLYESKHIHSRNGVVCANMKDKQLNLLGGFGRAS